MKLPLLTLVLILSAKFCFAVCCENEITEDDVAWDVGKREQRKGQCTCYYGKFKRTGTLYEYWDPARIIETVKDPGCMMAEGESDMELGDMLSHGTTHSNTAIDGDMAFQQVHITMPDFIQESLMENDMRCWHTSMGLPTDYLSEDDAAWNNEVVAALDYPLTDFAADFERILACVADSVTSQFGYPIDPFFWCMGSWGNTFPVNGHSGTNEYLTTQANVAGRAIYVGGRTGRILDTASYYCYNFPMLVWIKSYFNLQPVRPTVRNRMIPIGQSPILWESGLNASTCMDNFAWVLWRKRSCCDSSNGGSMDNNNSSGGGGGGGTGFGDIFDGFGDMFEGILD